MNKQMASSSVPNTPPVTDGSESKGFFGTIGSFFRSAKDTISSGVSAASGALKDATKPVTPSDASANPSESAAAISPATQVAAARYNRSVKKLKAESKKLMNVIEGKTRKSHKKTASKTASKTKKTPKTKKGGKHNKKH